MPKFKIEIILDGTEEKDVLALVRNIIPFDVQNATQFDVMAFELKDDLAWHPIGTDES